jgi:hypothetical protein
MDEQLATFYRDEELDEGEWLGYGLGSWCRAPCFSLRFSTLGPDDRFKFRKWGSVHKTVMEAEFAGDAVVPSDVVRTFFAIGMRDGFTEHALWLKPFSSREEDDWEPVGPCDDERPAELVPIFEDAPLPSGGCPQRLEAVCTVETPPPLQSFVAPKGPSTWPGRYYVPPGGQKPEELQEVECLFHDRHVASQMDCRLFFARDQGNPTPEEVVQKSEKPWRCNVFIDEESRVSRVCNG